MSQSAHVTSIAAIKEFRVALCRFGLDVREALCATELEIRRFHDWLEDQLKYWRSEIRRREEEVVRAKGELVQRKYARADGRGYTEQEKALEEATARLLHAQEKLKKVREWIHTLPQALIEYEGPARQLRGMVEAELTHALAVLDRKTEALEAYVSLTASPAAEQPTAAQNDAQGTASNDLG
jgi:hypothetical protein